MPTLAFEDYNLKVIDNPLIDDLRQEIRSLDRWFSSARNSGRLDYADGQRNESLTLVAHEQLGYCLCYSLMSDHEQVSVGDRDRLEEKTVMADGSWLAAGHFVSPDQAWIAIEEFCNTGNRSEKLDWIPVEELPDLEWWYE